MRARALLRLGRAAEALRSLQTPAPFHPSPDVVATMLMLTASAHVRLGDCAAGLALLEQARAVPGAVHATIRAEIALTAGLAYYGLRELTQAQECLELIPPDSDIVYARALEYRGWIESVRENYEAAARFFHDALAQLESCRHYDRYLEANALMALCSIAAEQLDMGRWEQLQGRREAFDWTAPGLATARFRIMIVSSVFAEYAGDVRAAFARAFEAEQCAGDDAQRAHAVLRRAEIARGSGDAASHVAFVDQADRMLAAVAVAQLRGDQVYLRLTLAEEFAHAGDRAKAEQALADFRSGQPPSSMLAASAEVRQRGYERMAEAHVAALAGDEARSLRGFLDAFEIFERVGFRRRAVQAALRLGALTRGDRYQRYAVAATAGLAQTFWMRREALAPLDPLLALVSAGERHTLRLLCAGSTNRQIAALQGRSYYTVRNSVSELLALFGVKDRRQLIAACVRLGLDRDPGQVTH